MTGFKTPLQRIMSIDQFKLETRTSFGSEMIEAIEARNGNVFPDSVDVALACRRIIFQEWKAEDGAALAPKRYGSNPISPDHLEMFPEVREIVEDDISNHVERVKRARESNAEIER